MIKVQRKVSSARRIKGVISVPGDKSISHRAVMIGALAEGTTEIEGFLPSSDCLHTCQCLRQLGISIESNGQADKLIIKGQGLWGLQEPTGILNAGNSGTTMRLLTGVLAGQAFTSAITGDASLCGRPMERAVVPLRQMGAKITGARLIERPEGIYAPLIITGGNLQPISYRLPVASAQVKSALLFAGLYTPGWTEILEPQVTRNHTELMLKAFGAKIERVGQTVRLKGQATLKAQKVAITGDLSSAAYLLVAGLIIPDSCVVIKNVGINPTRSGIIDILQAMGAKLVITEQEEIAGELRGTIKVESSSLQGISLGGEIIPRLIDELPVLAVAALFASGITEIRDAQELKVKESNRLRAICEGLGRLGGQVEELDDGLRIWGGASLQGAVCRSFGDHRIAMALAIAALGAKGETIIENADVVDVSFPGFWSLLDELRSGK